MTSLAGLFGTATVVPDVIDGARANELRDALERVGYTRYALLDRGSYDVLANPSLPELATVLGALVSHACEVTGRRLAIDDTRALRLGAGDYVLANHDRLHEDNPVELVLDLSRAVVASEVCYQRRGQVYFRFPSQPGALAIVERGPTVTSNHSYLTKRDPAASVIRIVALARGAPA
ncbi:MAG: hypothetical protein WKG01_35845 [Kofleriaceae bacterium]